MWLTVASRPARQVHLSVVRVDIDRVHLEYGHRVSGGLLWVVPHPPAHASVDHLDDGALGTDGPPLHEGLGVPVDAIEALACGLTFEHELVPLYPAFAHLLGLGPGLGLGVGLG